MVSRIRSRVVMAAAVASAGLAAVSPASASWTYSWRQARVATANVVYDRYGVDVLPREVGCVPGHGRRT